MRTRLGALFDAFLPVLATLAALLVGAVMLLFLKVNPIEAYKALWVNEAAQRMFGRLDLVGSKLETLMPAELAERHAGIIASYGERYVAGYKKTGEWYQLYQITFGGIPGKPFGDGPDGHSLWPSFTNVPNEFLESYFPLRIDIYETIPDTGGAGKNRGGNGLRIGYRFLEPGEISIHDDRWLTYPWGVNCGLPGARSKKTLVRADGTEALLPSKSDRVKVNEGDLLLSDTWGGGGCGDPFEREIEKVVFDVQAGLVTPQDLSLRYPLVDGQGNFGSVYNDPPAAMRYTEARFSKIAEEMLVGIEKDTVDFVPNFDGSLQEPSILPARLPNLLVNGSSGIAVGMTTNIPPHNLGEICDAIVCLIDKPEATAEELLELVKGPDFPTGGIIWGKGGIDNAYATGQGKIVLRAKARELTTKMGKKQILVTELPYQVNKAALVERIAELAKVKKISGIADVRDESDREGMRIVIELKREAQPRQVLNTLYKYTTMQSSFHINMVALVDGKPKVINLKEALASYIDFRLLSWL